MNEREIKEVIWIGSSRRDMQELPMPVRRVFGVALYAAQLGEKPPEAKPLKGFGGAGVLELVEDYQGGTYRAVYTVRFAEKIYRPYSDLILYSCSRRLVNGALPVVEIKSE